MNFISPVFICFRWWRSREGGCFPKLRVSISTHFHPTMSFSLYKTPYLYIHPPAVSPFPHPHQVVPAASPGRAAQCVLEKKEEQDSRRWSAMLFQRRSLWTPLKRKLYDSGKPNTTQLCAGSSAELRCCCWKVISNPKGLWGGKSHSRDTKKRPGPECRCSGSPTEHTAHRNLPRVPSALSQTPFTDSDLLGLSQIWVQLQHGHERGRRLLSTDCL